MVNLLRIFNIRHVLHADAPFARYGSAPVDGSHQGKTIKPVWPEMVQNYHRLIGWDIETGQPLPETLKSLGLEYTVRDIW